MNATTLIPTNDPIRQLALERRFSAFTLKWPQTQNVGASTSFSIALTVILNAFVANAGSKRIKT